MGRVLVRATWLSGAHSEPQHSSLQGSSSGTPGQAHQTQQLRVWSGRYLSLGHCGEPAQQQAALQVDEGSRPQGSVTIRTFFCFPLLIAELNELSTLMLFAVA